GHGRIEAHAAAAHATLHRAQEVVVGPGADAGLAIGRQVGGEKLAERRLDGAAAGIGLAIGIGMAGGAVGDGGEIAAALDGLEALPVACHALVVARRIGAAGTDDQEQAEKRAAPHDPPAAQLCTSAPGFFRYWLTIASAAQKASAPTVPVGL